ncbi:MAG: hypothetical protein ACYDH6_18275 [Acidimicrobiales bacterium]
MTRSPDKLTADFASLVRQVRVDDAVVGRTRERHLRASAAADATLLGILVDLAERAVPVAVHTTADRVVRGQVGLVATDVVSIGATFVPVRAIAAVGLPTRRRRTPDTSGDRGAPGRATFATIVGDLAARRARVTLVAGAGVIAGELRSAGRDVLTICLDAVGHATAVVALAQVSELTVLASG